MTTAYPAGADDVPARFLVDFTGQTLLGQYRIERRLAEGGMGSVYLAEDSNLGRRVVVKVPHARFLGEPGFRARFRREIEELVRLEHPHVVRILARGEQDAVPFFVLQYLGGGSLEDRLARGAETPAKTLAWLGMIAETLDFVHARGVIHRDVKPANILFDEAGHVFLSDFGVVKALAKDDGADLTAVGTGIGSPIYMAPEQGMGQGVSNASDQYALASALYEALSGAPPFGRGSVVEILVRKGREEAAPLRRSVPDLPEASEAAVARALARDPAQRFATCAEFAAAFREGLAPPPAPVAPRSRKALAALLLLAPLIVAFALTRGFGLWEGPAPATPTVPVAEPPTTKETPGLLRVVERGAEPRRLLRWKFSPGQREARLLRTTSRETSTFPGHPPKVEEQVTEREYEARVASVDEAGRARLEWRFPPARPMLEGGATAEDVARWKQMEDSIGTLEGMTRLAPSGAALESRLGWGKIGEVQYATKDVIDLVRSPSVVLPDEPIGVGARWEFTQIREFMDISYEEVSVYEVLAIEGPAVRFAARFRGDAPDQALTMGGFLPAEAGARLRTFTWEGTGEGRIHLERVLPEESSITVAAKFLAEIPGQGGGKIEVEHTGTQRTTAR